MKKGLVLFGLLVFVAMAGMGHANQLTAQQIHPSAVESKFTFSVEGAAINEITLNSINGGQMPRYSFDYERGSISDQGYLVRDNKRSGTTESYDRSEIMREYKEKYKEYKDEFGSNGTIDKKTGAIGFVKSKEYGIIGPVHFH